MDEMRSAGPAKKILGYFVRNPGAADTYDGIVRWRLLEEAIHQTTAETSEALSWLVATGFLDEVPVSGSAPVFRLNAERRREAEDFLGLPRDRKAEG